MLLVSVLASSSASWAQVSCTVSGQPVAVRAEGLAEILGDIILRCSGGTPPAVGAAVPQTDITVSLTTNITNRLVTEQVTEALLFVDDPASVVQSVCAPGDGLTACSPLYRGVDGATATLTPYNSFTNSNPVAANIFQGARQSDNTTVFRSVPIIPAGANSFRTLRIKGLRAAIAGATLPNGLVMATVALENGPSELQLAASAPVIVGAVQSGVSFALRNARGDGPLDTTAPEVNLNQCVDWNRDLGITGTARYSNERSFTVRFTELYAGAFKRRDIQPPLTQTNLLSQLSPQFHNGFDPFLFPAVTESGFYNFNFPITNGLRYAGRASAGTRLRLAFSGVPDHVRVFVSAHSLRSVAASCSQGRCQGGGPSPKTVAYGMNVGAAGGGLVISGTNFPVYPGSDAEVWDSGALNPQAIPSTFPPFTRAGSVPVEIRAGEGVATWEIFDEDPFAIDSVAFAVAFTFDSSAPPVPASIMVNGQLAPVSTDRYPRYGEAVPRFLDQPVPLASARIVAGPCATVQSISPTAINAGSAGFVLDVKGTGFTAQSVVQWNGSSRPTTLAGSELVRAQISAADIAQQGTARVTVSTAGSISNSLPFTVRVPPSQLALTSPANGATGAATRVQLVWAAAGAIWYEVYFGAGPNPPLLYVASANSYTVDSLSPGSTFYWRVVARNDAGSVSSPTWQFTTAGSPPTGSGLQFVPLVPCRVMDTRPGQGTSGTLGPPALQANERRALPIPTSRCSGIPASAKAYSLNVTAVPPAPFSYLTFWPTGALQSFVSTLNSFHGGVVSNAAIVPAGDGGSISVYSNDKTDLIIDVNGYFSATQGSSFYVVDPCRLADTRTGSGFSGDLGAPTLSAGSARSFPLGGGCGLPANAAAYSLNVTVVPATVLSYLTIWPSGQSQPFVSTLNSFDGSVVANAAIVPAGSGGAVSAFVTDRADVILDTNGYFGPSGGAGELRFYPVTPCRVYDTRVMGGPAPALVDGEVRNFAISGRCEIPVSAKAYSLNVTVVPVRQLGYLTMWPAGKPQPFVSTLNSYLGRVVANAALVPAGAGGAVSVFVTHASNVILDVNGYFQ